MGMPCSYYLRNPYGQELKSQTGCIRTNCMDCLDRTNVVQHMLAKRTLAQQACGCKALAMTSSKALKPPVAL
jgi:hypothetical protein